MKSSIEWRRMRFVDLCSIHVDCVNRTAPLAEAPTPYKMIRTTNVRDGFVDTDNVRYVSEETFKRWSRRLVPRRGDIVLTREAPLGGVGKIRTDDNIFLGQRLYHFRADPRRADPDFLLYSLMGPDLQAQIRGFGSGSTVEHMRLPDIEQLVLNAPPLDEQRRLGAVLAAYDDLFKNCERRVRVLVDMAQALYQEWFVNFRYPGYEKVPLVDSPRGRIPSNWTIREMRDVADIVDCLHGKKPSEQPSGPGMLLQLNNIGEHGLLDITDQYRINEEDYAMWSSRMELRAGDCVVTNVGRVGAVAQIPDGVRAAAGRNMTGIRAKAPLTPTYLIQYLLSSHMRSEVAAKKDLGTIMDSLNVKGIVRLLVPCPTPNLFGRFDEVAGPIRKAIEQLVKESANLRKTRELLLPRLLSGRPSIEAVAA